MAAHDDGVDDWYCVTRSIMTSRLTLVFVRFLCEKERSARSFRCLLMPLLRNRCRQMMRSAIVTENRAARTLLMKVGGWW